MSCRFNGKQGVFKEKQVGTKIASFENPFYI